MASQPDFDLPPASRSSFVQVPVDPEECRAFLQSRLGLYGLVTGTISLAFWLIQNTLVLALHGHADALREMVLQAGNLLHALAFATALGLGVLCRRGPPLAERTLITLDVVATVIIGLCYDSVLITAPRGSVPEATFVVALCLLAQLPARAIIVPSSAQRTLVVSLACALPALVFAALSDPPPPINALLLTISLSCWAATAVVIATVASRIIFGLTKTAREARQLGQYTLLEPIGSGGMGVVFKAQHAMLRRPTAIKLVQPQKVGLESLRRFEREVTQTARLTHPNTISIFDYGRTPEGVFYYAMEYLDGIDLQGLVEEHGPQPPERVVHLLGQICGSLAEAHDIGLIHRDVKPANIFVCERGGQPDVVKVLDFGLVKEVDPGPDGASMSRTNVLTGTPHYISPEAVQAPDEVGARSDLYAVGAVGFFLVTGRPVFEGKTVVEICAHHLHTEPPRPSAVLGREVPADLEDLLLRCLQKSQDQRPPNARALRDALLACASAGRWSDADARAWWSSHAQARKSPAAPDAADRPQTVIVALADRDAAAG